MAMDPWSRQALLREGLVLAVAAVLAVATAVLVPHETSTPLLALALVYVYGVGGVVVLHVRDSRRAARQRRLRAERERAVPLGTVVEAAVREERRRLALDIRRVLLEALSEVHERSGRLLEGDRSDEDVARAVPAIRARTQLATSELRRLLGILRAAEGTDGAPGQHELPPDGAGLPGPHPVPGRSGPLVLGRPRAGTSSRRWSSWPWQGWSAPSTSPPGPVARPPWWWAPPCWPPRSSSGGRPRPSPRPSPRAWSSPAAPCWAPP